MFIEMETERFRDICQLVRHLKAAGAFFTTQGTVYIESPVAPKRNLHGDYIFLTGNIQCKKAVAIGQKELLRIAKMLKLDRETTQGLRQEYIRIEAAQTTCLPYHSVFLRTTRYQLMDAETERRLDALSSQDGRTDFVLLPALTSAKRELSRGRTVHLTLQRTIIATSGKSIRVAGFSKVEDAFSCATPTGRALYAYVERHAARTDSMIHGNHRSETLHLRGNGLYARIKTMKRGTNHGENN